MLGEFKKFIARGNVIDMAVGIIIGAAFGTVVKSLVDDIIMPPVGKITGDVDFTNLYITLGPESYPSLAAAKAAGAATINYGVFLNNLISFLIVAFAVFLLVKAANKLQRPTPPAAAATQKCPHCKFDIPLDANRCGHCTAELKLVTASR
jgi:large conductance mechanosensitive channel